jgi:hypothetical protein
MRRFHSIKAKLKRIRIALWSASLVVIIFSLHDIVYAQIKTSDKIDILNTKCGKTYSSVTITNATESEIKIIHSEGVTRIALADLTSESLEKLGLQTKVSTNENDLGGEIIAPNKSDVIESLLTKWVTDQMAFKPGDYKKGQIPAGIYVWLKPLKGVEGYSFEEHGPADNLVTLENFETFGYVYVNEIGKISTGGWLVKPSAVLRSEQGSALKLFASHQGIDSYNFSGVYHVGTDIQPGTYLFKKVGSSHGSIRIWSDGPPGKGENRLELVRGELELNLNKNSFIQVDDCFISRK